MELRIVAKISKEEGDTPTLSYIRDLIEQLNRALREVTFGEDRCSKGILRRLSRCEGGLLEEDEAITSSGIRKTTRSKDNDTLTPSNYSDCLEDEILDRHEIGITSREIYWGDFLFVEKLKLFYLKKQFIGKLECYFKKITRNKLNFLKNQKNHKIT